MAKLAIRGHATRGKEVIEILEMLGGKNDSYYCSGEVITNIYFINDYGYINCCYNFEHSDYLQLTLEEFEDKFPYKVGDEVIIKKKNQIATIEKITWCCDTITYWLKYGGYIEGNWRVEHLKPCKEETMEEELMPKIDFSKYCKNKYLLDMGDYEIKFEDGKTYAVRKRTQYPKTYEECCDILGFKNRNKTMQQFLNSCDLYDSELMIKLSMLKVCRDAYWKIAGEELGLGKPWEPVWKGKGQQEYKFCIYTDSGEIQTGEWFACNAPLAFPTIKIRDTFYENFKDLIEQCKELL